MKPFTLVRILIFFFGLTLLLSSCGTSKKVADFSGVQVEKSDPIKIDTARAVKVETAVRPELPPSDPIPTPPVNPTRRESRDYKRQLKAWAKAQEARAEASRLPKGPKVVKLKGTGLTNTVAQVATGGHSEVQNQPVVAADKLKGNAVKIEGNGNTVQQTKGGSNTWLWIIGALAAAYGVWYLIAGGLVGFFARSNWKVLAVIFAALAGVLVYLFH
jgi:hypothetical protein